jgi:hypothetical protein
MAEDEAKLLADAARLPIAERAAHPNWKVRSAAYDDIKTSCARVIDSSDPVLVEYGKHMTGCCVTSGTPAVLMMSCIHSFHLPKSQLRLQCPRVR